MVVLCLLECFLKKVLQKKFDVTEVDEFKTSKTCNLCFGEMSGYVKRDGRKSYSRLCYWNCAGRCERFADRDLNATANVLTCKQRSLVFARSHRRKGSEEESASHKKTKLSVDAERTLSDPVPLTSKDVNGIFICVCWRVKPSKNLYIILKRIEKEHWTCLK